MKIKNYQTVLLDLSHVNNSYSQIKIKPIDGVLGSDILHKYIKQNKWHSQEFEMFLSMSANPTVKKKRKIEVLTGNYPLTVDSNLQNNEQTRKQNNH